MNNALPADIAPSLDDLDRLARAAWDALPDSLRAAAEGLEIRIADFASEDQLQAVDLEDPFSLSGLYEGVALPYRSLSDPVPDTPRVWLFRRAILDEWAERGNVGLGELVTHVLIHEVGHHFGWSDAEMDALLAEAEAESEGR